jgi:hypothetical protein
LELEQRRRLRSVSLPVLELEQLWLRPASELLQVRELEQRQPQPLPQDLD